MAKAEAGFLLLLKRDKSVGKQGIICSVALRTACFFRDLSLHIGELYQQQQKNENLLPILRFPLVPSKMRCKHLSDFK